MRTVSMNFAKFMHSASTCLLNTCNKQFMSQIKLEISDIYFLYLLLRHNLRLLNLMPSTTFVLYPIISFSS